MRLKFTGDLSLNGRYSSLIYENKDPFIGVAGFFENSDLNITNLEATCKSPIQENHTKKTRLSIEPETLDYLSTIKTNLVTLANNHIYDNLESGFNLTLDILEKKDIHCVGASRISSENNPYIYEANGKKLAIMNYVHPLTHPGVDESDSIKLNVYNKRLIIDEIERLKKQNDYVILILHWGQDNSRYPAPWQRKDAKAFAEAGVSLIVGHHSHVLQGYERMGKSWVLYSLGNFAFAPVKCGNINDLSKRQQESVICDCILDGRSIELKFKPVKLKKLFVTPDRKTKIHLYSHLLPLISNPLIWPLYRFYLNIFVKFFHYFFGSGRNPFEQIIKIDKRKFRRALQIVGICK